MSDLSREAIAAIDPQGMLGDVLEQPAHLEDALWRVESAAIDSFEAPGGLAICGMGGSAIGADLAAAAIGARAHHPIITVRGYELPAWVDESWAVLCSSYSGNTEETTSCYAAAGEAGARRIALTTGGKLAEAARAELEGAAELARELAAEWGPDGDEDGDAKALARRLHETVPVIAGPGIGAAAAYRWK